MQPSFYDPGPLLAPYIRHYVLIENDMPVDNRVLPDRSLVFAFRFKGHIAYTAEGICKAIPGSVVTGLRKSARIIHYAAGSGMMLVVFRTAAATAFIRTPLHELSGDSHALDAFMGRQRLADIEEQLAEASSGPDKVKLLETFLLSCYRPSPPDLLVRAAMEQIEMAAGTLSIAGLSKTLFISQDAFEKRFRRAVGTSAKQYACLVRMHRAIASGRQGVSLPGIAFDAGYCDQPHFNKDFRLFTGQTPTAFFRQPVFW